MPSQGRNPVEAFPRINEHLAEGMPERVHRHPVLPGQAGVPVHPALPGPLGQAVTVPVTTPSSPKQG